MGKRVREMLYPLSRTISANFLQRDLTHQHVDRARQKLQAVGTTDQRFTHLSTARLILHRVAKPEIIIRIADANAREGLLSDAVSLLATQCETLPQDGRRGNGPFTPVRPVLAGAFQELARTVSSVYPADYPVGDQRQINQSERQLAQLYAQEQNQYLRSDLSFSALRSILQHLSRSAYAQDRQLVRSILRNERKGTGELSPISRAQYIVVNELLNINYEPQEHLETIETVSSFLLLSNGVGDEERDYETAIAGRLLGITENRTMTEILSPLRGDYEMEKKVVAQLGRLQRKYVRTPSSHQDARQDWVSLNIFQNDLQRYQEKHGLPPEDAWVETVFGPFLQGLALDRESPRHPLAIECLQLTLPIRQRQPELPEYVNAFEKALAEAESLREKVAQYGSYEFHIVPPQGQRGSEDYNPEHLVLNRRQGMDPLSSLPPLEGTLVLLRNKEALLQFQEESPPIPVTAEELSARYAVFGEPKDNEQRADRKKVGQINGQYETFSDFLASLLRDGAEELKLAAQGATRRRGTDEQTKEYDAFLAEALAVGFLKPWIANNPLWQPASARNNGMRYI